jgi:hypothetical protein
MATFRVGQRVRVVSMSPGVRDDSRGRMIGAEGVIARRADDIRWDWVVDLPAVPGRAGYGMTATEWYADSGMLAPLTDPRASEFIEDMERFSRVTRKVPAGDELPSLREVLTQQLAIAASKRVP